MAGQVKHVKLFSGVDAGPDAAGGAGAGCRRKNTDALISAVADVLQEHGITLMDSTALLRTCWRGPAC